MLKNPHFTIMLHLMIYWFLACTVSSPDLHEAYHMEFYLQTEIVWFKYAGWMPTPASVKAWPTFACRQHNSKCPMAPNTDMSIYQIDYFLLRRKLFHLVGPVSMNNDLFTEILLLQAPGCIALVFDVFTQWRPQ
jgi:hypothetical protein